MVEVKTGLFEGDLVVTRRAPQLYAQSLRGGSQVQKGENKQEQSSIQNPKSKIQNSLPWWLVIPASGGVAAIALGSFWLGRRSKPSAERLAYETSNGSKSPNGSAELSESYNGKLCELPVLAEKNHHHSESDRHH